MLFKIQNLGAVKEAEIDLSKDLILLCGHNNTGKTYVAYAISYILVYELGMGLNDALERLLSNYPEKYFQNPITVKIAHELIEKKELTINLFDYLDNWILPFQKDILDEIFEIYKNKNSLARFFSSDKVEAAQLSLFFTKEQTIKYIQLHEEQKDFIALLASNISVKYYANLYTWKLRKEEGINRLIRILYHSIFNYISFKEGYFERHIFPAERSAINIFNTELSLIKNKVLQAVLKDNSLTDLAQRRVNRYPQPIRDSLELSQDLETLAKTTSPFAYLADELEQAILKGKISVGQYGDLRYSPAESPDLKLEMHVSSSLVKSLASISFYLRHIAQKGDCIIIDEPELNLHPDNQILVARFLARLVNEGFKVIASTHSDYIIRELNNLILLNNDFPEKKSLIEKYKYQENQLLSAEKVGAYIFKDGYGKEVPLSNQGIEIQSIDTVIADLNQRSDDIYYSYSDSLPQKDN